MGIVYRARDPIINRLVALKTITTGVADYPNLLQRFYREAQSAGALQHPNIVTIYDMGDEGGIPYIAMELIEGESLEQLVARRGALPVSLKLVYAVQACRAFDYAHKRGIIHRDIKPGNVMINKEGTVKVVDFGIARIIETSKTVTGMLLGTFAYMSPDQYQGEHADERSDIWSFGVLLYELLGYQRPFAGATPASLMHSICQEEPRPLCEVVPDCPAELELVVHKMLQKSAAGRYQSMEEVLLELDPICRSLQSETVAELVGRSRQLADQGDYSQARDLLRQALQVDSTNLPARALLEKVNAELKRILIRPKAQEHVEKGHALLEGGRIQEARTEAESALRLDSNFEPAQELQKQVQRESDRAQLVTEWLQSSKQRLAEGIPDEAGELLAKVLEIDPSNEQAKSLQHQVIREKAERQRRLRLLEAMQHARSLWTQQNFGECIQFLIELQQEFPEEEEIPRLLETAREDQAEQRRQQGVAEARNLLAAGRYEECNSLLTDLQKQFPSDDEIPRLFEDVREDRAKQRRLQGLAAARSYLAARDYEECISLLTALQKEFPDEDEVLKLLVSAREDESEQRRQQGVADARNLLAARRYEEANVLLAELQEHFPDDDEIPKVLNAVREDQAEQRKLQGLAEARNLLAARRYDTAKALLADLQKQFPKDDEIPRLLDAVREDEAEQRKLQGLAEARNLLASRHYEESISLLSKLQTEFPGDDEISKLLESAGEEQVEQRKLQGLAEARNLLAARRYEESISLLTKLQAEFRDEKEIRKLLEAAREDQAENQKLQKLAAARALLAEQRFQEALAVLDALGAAHPKDAGVQKLRALIEREQEKQAKLERLQREWELLKKLVSEKKYPEIISRAEKALRDFPGDTDLARLIEFARLQQAQIERDLLLRKVLEETKGLYGTNRFEEAVRAAQSGLKTFPENKELLFLREQAEIQQRKLETRQSIELRIREIKFKINREKFSEAIEMAKQTLVTLGPDTDVTQLLNSAQMEYQARARKREQERKLAMIRALMESKKVDQAAQTLDDALVTRTLDSFDPRVQRVSEEIEAAKTAATAETTPATPSGPPALSREYAFLQGPPVESTPAPREEVPAKEMAATQAAAAASSQPVPPAPSIAPSTPPQVAPVSSAPVVQPPEPAVTEPAGQATVRPAEPRRRPEIPPRVPVAAAPSAAAEEQPIVPTPIWRRPATLATALLGLIAVVWMGVHLFPSRQTKENPPVATTNPAPPKPAVNPLEVQQRDAINAADRLVAANDLKGALQKLQPAEALNGPLTAEIKKREAEIAESMKNKDLAQLRQREAQLWQQAMKQVDSQRYPEALKSLQRILALPDGGVRKDEARQYVDKVIPQRQEEQKRNQLIASLQSDARRDLRQGDFRSARQKVDQIQSKSGDATGLLSEIEQSEKGDLGQLENQFNQYKQGEDDAAVRQLRNLEPKFQALANSGGPYSVEARSYIEKIPGAIGDVQARAASKGADAVFQQAVQSYKALNGNDGSALEAARKNFQSIAQGGGPHASEAQKYLDEVNTKLKALNQPPREVVPPPAKPEALFGSTVDRDAIAAVIERFRQAFEERDRDALRRVWPSMSEKQYAGYKKTFEAASAIHIRVQNETIGFSADGATATVKALFEQEYTPKEGKTRNLRSPWVFRLAKSDGTWTITDAR